MSLLRPGVIKKHKPNLLHRAYSHDLVGTVVLYITVSHKDEQISRHTKALCDCPSLPPWRKEVMFLVALVCLFGC